MPNKVINVFYHGRKVGRLALTDEQLCAFEYDGQWLNGGFAISPFKLPLEKKVFVARPFPFDGGFGIFDDSLPDGWGRLLIDRLLSKKHLNPAAVSLLDRLAVVGSSGRGALEYRPAAQMTASKAGTPLAVLAREAEAVLQEKHTRRLEELVQAGGSSGGARPKVLLKIAGEHWLIKFRVGEDPRDIGRREYHYAEVARKSGLAMPQTRLFEKKYFGVKRFDRGKNGSKIHMLSASALLDSSHRFPALDYVDLLKAALALTRDYNEVYKLFRLMCFNVFAHNRDDHAKNFSFLYAGGKWLVSPPYDLVYAEGLGGEHATAVAGEGKNPAEKHILLAAAAAGLDLRTAGQIMSEVKTAVKKYL
ncbi:MAG: type II toxin-antitoxin system HipA family toxin [Candidatus Margulisbacteria bacterium]|jgi:serine/threonine-protein kinase HipA|nr:type II toxin-antitoxin system HipA family toxin [Candidatus Margulisiibacteriota bacterium]